MGDVFCYGDSTFTVVPLPNDFDPLVLLVALEEDNVYNGKVRHRRLCVTDVTKLKDLSYTLIGYLRSTGFE